MLSADFKNNFPFSYIVICFYFFLFERFLRKSELFQICLVLQELHIGYAHSIPTIFIVMVSISTFLFSNRSVYLMVMLSADFKTIFSYILKCFIFLIWTIFEKIRTFSNLLSSPRTSHWLCIFHPHHLHRYGFHVDCLILE